MFLGVLVWTVLDVPFLNDIHPRFDQRFERMQFREGWTLRLRELDDSRFDATKLVKGVPRGERSINDLADRINLPYGSEEERLVDTGEFLLQFESTGGQ